MDRLRQLARVALRCVQIPVRAAAAGRSWLASTFDLWDLLAAVSVGLLGWGVWEQWGAPWARMLWGVLGLGLVVVRAVSLRRA